ncbi:hypothetical protein GCM10027596_02710 [Nocardioides korecus]
MTQSTHPTTLNITPSPRILEMIAEVDLQLHQCLSELIDNALDELVEAVRSVPALEPRIDVTLPKKAPTQDSIVSVGDNGRGMSAEQLQEALSAGTSGKQRFGSLGLFGMGFNIATARLGTLTDVRTGRVGDDQWVIATIDLLAMQRSSSYEVPLRYEDKSTEEHGTLISVTKLRDDIVARLSRNSAVQETRGHLGRIYTYMLRDPSGAHSGASLMGGASQSLYVNSTPVRPHLPCIWDPSRSVTYKGGDVPAGAKVDIPLTNAFACMNCGRWSPVKHESCVECESTEIEERERRIWGWLGIQRYADKSDFGVTFFRHGRAITYQDKSLFDWVSPDGEIDLEYPIELGMGRIVGEIHLDHAPVNVRKTNFDKSSSEWRFMVDRIRGEEPLRPQYSVRLMGRENTSPMSRFFNAFRENKPGLRYLIPGNGSTSIHDTAKSWATKFRKGDPEFETDEKWYEAAKEHDVIKAGPAVDPTTQTGDDDEWLDEEGLSHLNKPTSDDEDSDEESETTEPVKQETEDERFARYQSASTLLPDTDKVVRIGTSQPVLRVYVTTGVDLNRDGAKRPYEVRVVAGEIEVYVDSNADLTAKYGWTVMNVALMCAAEQLARVYSFDGPVHEMVTSILDQFPDRRVDPAAVRARADSLLDSLRERLAEIVPKDPETFWEALSGQAKREAESVAISIASDVDWAGAITSGEFARYLSAEGVADLVTGIPHLVFDGAVFRSTYAPLADETQSDQVARVVGLVSDLRRMTAVHAHNPQELSRFLLTADLLDSEIVAS